MLIYLYTYHINNNENIDCSKSIQCNRYVEVMCKSQLLNFDVFYPRFLEYLDITKFLNSPIYRDK